MEPPFDSERERLDWLLDELEARFESSGPVQISSKEDLELFLVIGPLVRLAYAHAKGISTLLEAENPDAVGPVERALYELWGDVKYMLSEGNPASNAVKLKLNAALEVAGAVGDSKEELRDHPTWGGLARFLDDAAEEYPELLDEVRKQREDYRFHWSGIRGRVGVLKAALGEEAGFVYKALSWESHATVTALRDVDFPDPGKGRVEFKPGRDKLELYEGTAFRVGGMLYNIWGLAANRFDFETVELPTSGESEGV